MLLTPEEWVRQHIVHFLIHEKKYTNTSINTEVVVEIVGMKKRADIIVYRKDKPFIIVECKAPSIKINQETFDHRSLQYEVRCRLFDGEQWFGTLLLPNGL